MRLQKRLLEADQVDRDFPLDRAADLFPRERAERSSAVRVPGGEPVERLAVTTQRAVPDPARPIQLRFRRVVSHWLW